MDFKFNPTGNLPSSLTLKLVKSYLRIDHEAEDAKINDLIETAVSFWEERTGYLLREGNLKLNFTREDRRGYEKRKEKSYADKWGNRRDYYTNLNKYSVPLIANIESQRPLKLSFYPDELGISTSSNLKQEVLTNDEIATLPENFFFLFSRNEEILSFSLNWYNENDYIAQVLRDREFTEYSFFPIELEVSVKERELQANIRQALIRIILNLYENPDTAQSFFKDEIIQSAFAYYNAKVGL